MIRFVFWLLPFTYVPSAGPVDDLLQCLTAAAALRDGEIATAKAELEDCIEGIFPGVIRCTAIYDDAVGRSQRQYINNVKRCFSQFVIQILEAIGRIFGGAN